MFSFLICIHSILAHYKVSFSDIPVTILKLGKADEEQEGAEEDTDEVVKQREEARLAGLSDEYTERMYQPML